MNGMENNVVWNGAGQHGCMQAVAGLLHIGMREPFCIEGVADMRFFFSEDGLYAVRMAADAPEITMAEMHGDEAVLDKVHLCDLLSQGGLHPRGAPLRAGEPDYYYYMADDETVHRRNWHGTFVELRACGSGQLLPHGRGSAARPAAAHGETQGKPIRQHAASRRSSRPEDRDEISLFRR